MEDSSKWEARIQDYVDGLLSEKEKAAFEAEIEQSPDLQEQVEQYQQTLLHLKAHHYSHLHEEMRSWAAEQSEEAIEPPRTVPLRLIWTAAAAVVVPLILVIGYQLLAENYYGPNRAKNETDYQYLALDRTERGPNQVLPPGTSAFQNQQFDQAIPLLKTWRDTTGQIEEEALLYLGQSFIGKEEADSALFYLRELATRKGAQNIFGDQLNWHMALAFISKGQKDSADARLRTIIERKEYKEADAKALQKDLQGKWYDWFND